MEYELIIELTTNYMPGMIPINETITVKRGACLMDSIKMYLKEVWELQKGQYTISYLSVKLVGESDNYNETPLNPNLWLDNVLNYPLQEKLTLLM